MATAMQKAQAIDAIYDFEHKPGVFGWFTKVPRAKVAEGLRDRVLDPTKINTAKLNLCGPAALVYALCRDNPLGYAKLAISLYDTGRGQMGSIALTPSVNLRVSNPPLKDSTDPNEVLNAADYVLMASIRDSTNYIAEFSSADTGFGGITLPGALKEWFVACGYSDVIEECNVWFNKDEASLRKANDLMSKDYKVSLFINAQVLYESSQNDWSSIPTHWVMLNDPFVITNTSVRFTCFTWGVGNRAVPQGGSLTLEGFLNNYYGFVAAKASAESAQT